MAALANQSMNITTYISATITIPSALLDPKFILPEYELDLSPYMLKKLGVKW